MSFYQMVQSVLDLKEDKVLYQNCIPWERALELFDVLETYHTFYDVYAWEQDGVKRVFMIM